MKIIGLEKLSKDLIESIAEKVITHFDGTVLDKPQQTPLNLFIKYLSDIHGITTHLDKNLGYIDGEKILGGFFLNPLRIEIDKSVVNTSSFKFTLAHEIGHLTLHRKVEFVQDEYNQLIDTEIDYITGKKKLMTDKDWLEWQANYFASAFLMPRKTFLAALIQEQYNLNITRNIGKIYLDYQKENIRFYENIKQALSQAFGVSKVNIEYRLNSLDLIKDIRFQNIKHISYFIQ
ncbi:MAG: ImmA/IrrE family metallo-endopeptidase [Thermoflexibacter sp.]|jgi:predicted transcriptional regulator|nr:ImmA/IrrE family metallo-endopeptidase [Thermoflexibacter sp.]